MTADWPDWELSWTAVRHLARYVDPESTHVPIGAHLRGTWSGHDEGRRRAVELCRLVFDRRINHAADPFASTRRPVAGGSAPLQRIRTPGEVVGGVASCLDVSLLFAGMAIAADLRPLVGLTLDTVPGHALVVLDLSAPLSGLHDAGAGEGPGGWERTEDTGVWLSEKRAPGQGGDIWWRPDGSRWLVVDVDLLTRRTTEAGHDGDFATALRRALVPELPVDDVDTMWGLVDVVAAQRPDGPYTPPPGLVHYPIHMRLPELTEFRDYPSRRALSSPELLRDGGILVLHGPGGRGKSTLAQRLAWQADNGCGWFLNATDAPTLKASLAAAELAERGEHEELGERAERLAPPEIEQLAHDALDRLVTSQSPWVVVLDNCDRDPRDPALAAVLPRPRHARQVVIVTTRDDRWLTLSGTLPPVPVPPLEDRDLAVIDLPPAYTEVAAEPLIAEPLAVLHHEGRTPSAAGDTPHHMIWRLVRETLRDQAEATDLARLLAWAPPDAVDVTDAPVGSPERAAKLLADLRFVTTATGPNRLRRGGPVRLHRLFAEAVRAQTWADEPRVAAATVYTLLTSAWGKRNLLDAGDQTALRHLEQVDAERAARTDPASAALIWYGLGHVRERRGPVRDSGPHFERALSGLAADRHYERAEAMVGRSRIVYQGQSSVEELTAAQDQALVARTLLESVPGPDAANLSEQANALYWLIRRKLVTRTVTGERLVDELAEVLSRLELSLDRRLRLARGLTAAAPLDPPYPVFADGLGAERAYYNLAGTYLELAKARFVPGSPPDGRIEQDLQRADDVFRKVGDLRAQRYRGRTHPHHASCVHGRAIVDYHRMAMLGHADRVVAACRFVTEGLAERWEVASWTPGASPERVARDGDVGKSFDLLGKIAVAAHAMAGDQPAGHAVAQVAHALGELGGWRGWR